MCINKFFKKAPLLRWWCATASPDPRPGCGMRVLSQAMQGLVKQLLAAGATVSLQQETLRLGLVAVNALHLPFQQAWLHSPAGSFVASSAHSYHGSRDDEDSSSSSSSSSSSTNGSKQANKASGSNSSNATDATSSSEQITQQLKALQEALDTAREAQERGQQAKEAAQLPDYIARHAMQDPLGALMTGFGVPLGISLRVNPDSVRQQRERAAEADKRGWQELLDSADSSSRSEAREEQYTAVPDTDAQLLRAKLVKATRQLVTASKAAKKASKAFTAKSSSSSSCSSDSASTQEQQEQQQAELESKASQHSPGHHQEATVGQQVKLQLEHLLASGDSDSYGTTRQTPAEIAQLIADSNRRAAGGGGGGAEGDGDGKGAGGDDNDEPLSLSAAEERYADEVAVTAELKEMDEIYEVLAKVPWLDDQDVDERELRGVVAVGLLGTLEEVGWQLREKLLTLWAGERDLDVLTAGVGAREAGALTAILYHTEQLEREFDKPPAAGVAAALAAAAGAPQAVAKARAAEARAALEVAEKADKPKH